MSTKELVLYTAKLAKIPLDKALEDKLSAYFVEILKYLDNLEKLDTQKVNPTYQVTGLTNVFRDDIVDVKTDFSLNLALSNGNSIINGMYATTKVL